MSIVASHLADRYQFGRPLGSGGAADVLSAQDTLLGRPVAIKVLHQRLGRDSALVGRFERAEREAARLSHPNAATVYDVGAHGRTHYVVTELVDGRTLAELLGRVGALPPDDAVRLAVQVAAARVRARPSSAAVW